MAEDIFEKRRRNAALSYEDPILLNEAKRRMQQTMRELEDEGIDVNHYYNQRPFNTPRGGTHKPSAGNWQASTRYDVLPNSQSQLLRPRKTKVNVPATPSLANWLVLNEEASHAREAQRRPTVHRNQLSLSGKIDDKRLAEEKRAKAEAKEMLGGYLTPEVQDILDWTMENYQMGNDNYHKARQGALKTRENSYKAEDLVKAKAQRKKEGGK